MKIKTGEEIQVFFTAKALKDVDGSIFMDWIMDNIPNFVVSNPGYMELKSNPESERMAVEKMLKNSREEKEILEDEKHQEAVSKMKSQFEAIG